MLYFIAAILGIANLYSFILFSIDKYKAKKQTWRIAENKLLKSGLLGGSLGGILAMHLWRHKISKPSFYWRMYGILFVQIILIAALFHYNILPF